MNEIITPIIGEVIDLPGIGKCEAVEKTEACTHKGGDCALAFSDHGKSSLFVCNSRDELKLYSCENACFRKLEDHE